MLIYTAPLCKHL